MSKKSDILMLARMGCARKAISRELGVSMPHVYTTIAEARARGETIPKTGDLGRPPTVHIPHDQIVALERHGIPRGVCGATIVARLVETALREDMIDAILDDGVQHA